LQHTLILAMALHRRSQSLLKKIPSETFTSHLLGDQHLAHTKRAYYKSSNPFEFIEVLMLFKNYEITKLDENCWNSCGVFNYHNRKKFIFHMPKGTVHFMRSTMDSKLINLCKPHNITICPPEKPFTALYDMDEEWKKIFLTTTTLNPNENVWKYCIWFGALTRGGSNFSVNIAFIEGSDLPEDYIEAVLPMSDEEFIKIFTPMILSEDGERTQPKIVEKFHGENSFLYFIQIMLQWNTLSS